MLDELKEIRKAKAEELKEERRLQFELEKHKIAKQSECSSDFKSWSQRKSNFPTPQVFD